jgi:hypothetical protein
MHVSTQARRIGLLAMALTFMAMLLVACTGNPVAVTPNSGGGGLNFQTPDTAQNTATPTFPPFTVGVWVSNYSPNVNDTITIYVITRVQDITNMTNPPHPPAPGLQVNIILEGPINGSLTGQTGVDGIAAISYPVNDPYVGQPVTIIAHVQYGGKPYSAQSFFTSSPGTAPTATPSGTPKGIPTP